MKRLRRKSKMYWLREKESKPIDPYIAILEKLDKCLEKMQAIESAIQQEENQDESTTTTETENPNYE